MSLRDSVVEPNLIDSLVRQPLGSVCEMQMGVRVVNLLVLVV